MKPDFGPGYRVCCVERGAVVTVLLCGGDKSTQQRDIDLALRLTAQLE
jgi:putative addiction module killer protein